MASQDWFEKDFYKTLGVSPDADDAEIKKAYRKLARANHPDQHPGDEAAEQRFKEIGEAYQVLSDAEDRQQYDAIRQMAAGGARFSAGGGSGGPLDALHGARHGGGAGFGSGGDGPDRSRGGRGGSGCEAAGRRPAPGGTSAAATGRSGSAAAAAGRGCGRRVGHRPGRAVR